MLRFLKDLQREYGSNAVDFNSKSSYFALFAYFPFTCYWFLVMADVIKTRTYCMVLYPYEDINHYAVMDKLETGGYMYLAIDHDCDRDDDGELLKSHTHVYLRLKSPRFRKPLADELGLPENYLEECRNSKAFMQYMVHDGFPDKYQYDHDKVYGSLKHEFNKIFISSDEGSRVLQILELL